MDKPWIKCHRPINFAEVNVVADRDREWEKERRNENE